MNRDTFSYANDRSLSPMLDLVTPLSARMLVWRARYLKESPFLHHLPFLFWLIEVCRPKLYVHLGVGDGVGYFGACQALERVRIDARSYGVNLECEQDDADRAGVYQYNDENYGTFSYLTSDSLSGAARQFEDGSVDLLMVDLDMDDKVACSLIDDWAQKLSERAVVGLHGTNRRSSKGQAALYQRFKRDYPTIEFDNGHGLMMVLRGNKVEERLARLASIRSGTPGHSELRDVLARLGMAHHLEWMSQAEANRRLAIQEALNTSEDARGRLEIEREHLQSDLRRLTESERLASDRITELQDRVFELQREKTLMLSQIETLKRSLAAKGAEVQELQGSLEARFRELATLTDHCEILQKESRAAKGELTTRLTKLRKEHDALNRRLAKLRKEHYELCVQHAELRNSTSWKATAPIRWLVSSIRRKRRVLQKSLFFHKSDRHRHQASSQSGKRRDIS